MKTYLLLIIVFLNLTCRALAQADLTVGFGTYQNSWSYYPCPLPDLYEGSRMQFLYRASELIAVGMSKGKISAIKFDVASLNGQGVIEQYTVKIGTATLNSLDLASWVSGTTQVYGPVDMSAVVGWNEITFTTPFTWNGVDNLVIEICTGDPNNGSSNTGTKNCSIRQLGLTFTCAHTYLAMNSGNLCGTTNAAQFGDSYYRPNTIFRWQSDDSCLPVRPIYRQNFDTAPSPNLPICTYEENFSLNKWKVDNGHIFTTFPGNKLMYISNMDTANAWFYTRGVNLGGSTSYRLTFRYGNYTAINGKFEKMNVMYGTAPTRDSMHYLLADYPNIIGNKSDTGIIDFIPPGTGVYYVGFHAYSNPDQYYLLLDDIKVDLTPIVPIVLTSFTGRREGESNLLLWNTTTESNNKGFTVQRSLDGRYYTDVAFVPSRAIGGNSTTTLGYFYIDEHAPAAGKSGWYYRLKQTDKDGRSSLSAVVSIKGESTKGLVITSVYPNPATSAVNVNLYASAGQIIKLTLSDMAGRVMIQRALAVQGGDNKLLLETSGLQSGNYMLKVVGSSEGSGAMRIMVNR